MGGSYIAIYIDGKQTNKWLTSGGSYVPDKPVAFNLGTLYSNVSAYYVDIAYGGDLSNTNKQADNNGPMLLDAKISLGANTKDFIEYLANPSNGHQYATSRIPNSNENGLIYLLSNEFIGFNANVTCESDVIVGGELTTYGETKVYAQSNFYDTAHFHGNVIFDSSASIVYDSSLASHINIFSSPDFVNYDNTTNNNKASLLIQNAGGLPENTPMPSMLVYNSINPIQDITNTENLVFSIIGDSVSVGPEHGSSSFNVLGDSMFVGNLSIFGNLNTVGTTTHGGGDFSHDGTMYLSNVNISGRTHMQGSVDISNAVTIDGSLNVTNDANINGLTVGVGGGNISSNSVVGQTALSENRFGQHNSAFGYAAGASNINGNYNTYIGYGADNSGNNNYDNSTAIGYDAKITTSDQIVLGKSTDSNGNAPTVYIPGNVGIGTDNSDGLYALDVSGGAYVRGTLNINNGVNINGLNIGFGSGDISTNCVVGQTALSENTFGSYNSAFGYLAGSTNTTGVNNTYLGYNSTADANNYNNSTALGYNATITSSDQIVLGQTTNAPTVYIPGKVGIGIDNQDGVYAVDIDGGVRMDGSLNVVSGGATINGVTTFNSSVYGVRGEEYDSNNTIDNKFATLEWVQSFLQNGGGVWTVDGSNSTIIHNNPITSQVGIGTTNPSTTLDVSGGVNISNQLTVSGGATIYGVATINNGLDVSGGATIHGDTTFYNAVTGQTNQAYNDDIKNTFATLDWVDWFIKNEGGVWSVDACNNTIIHNTNLNSSVGIGTTNPTTTLDVSGGVNVRNGLDVSGGATIYGRTTVHNRLDVSGGATIHGDTTFYNAVTGQTNKEYNDDIKNTFATLDWVDWFIKNEGGVWSVDACNNTIIHNTNLNSSVGIGTTNPTTTLDVSGGVNVRNGLDVSGGATIYGRTTVHNRLDVSGGATIHGDTTFYNAVTGQTNKEYNDDIKNTFATLDWVDWFIKNEGGVWSVDACNNTIIHNTNLNSSVGIGTTNPSTTLDVSGGVNITNQLTVSGGAIIYGGATVHNSLDVSGGATIHGDTTFYNAVTGQTNQAYNDDIKNTFATLDWVDWFIKNEGGVWSVDACNNTIIHNTNLNSSVGIGTTNPSTTLDVSGGVNITNQLTVSGGAIIYGGATVHNSLDVSGGATIHGDTTFYNAVTGQTNQAYNDDIKNTFATLDWVDWFIKNEGGVWSVDACNNTIIHNTNLNSSVGIGTTNPSTTLDVSGGVNITNQLTVSGGAIIYGGATVHNSLDVSGGATIHGDTTFYNAVTGQTNKEYNDDIKNTFATLDWVDWFIKNEGGVWSVDACNNTIIHNTNLNSSVGIGTTNPTTTLDVSGGVNVRNGLDVSGGATIYGRTTVHNRLDVSGGATIHGDTTFYNAVTGQTNQAYNDDIKNTFATLDWVDWFIKNEGGVWSVDACNNTIIHNTNLNSSVGIGTTSPTTTLDVSGGVNISNGLDVLGGATISGGTTINNGLTLSGELIAYNGATIHAGMTVEDAITLTGSMSVSNSIGISNGMTIYGGGAIIDGSVNIFGYTEISGTTVIDGYASVKKNMAVGTTLIDPSYALFVSGDVGVSGDIIHTGKVKHSGTINMSGSINIDGDTVHTGHHTTSGIMNVNILEVSGNGLIGGQLTVTSGCSVGGQFDVSGGANFHGASHFSEEVTGTISHDVTSGKYFPTLDWVNNRISTGGVGGWTETELSGNYIIHNVNSGNVGIGTPTPQAKLDVNGTLNVEHDVTMRGSVSIPTGPLDVSGGATIDGGIHVSGTSHFSEEVTGTISNEVTSGKYFPTLDWVNNRISTGGVGGWTETELSGNYNIHNANNGNVGIGTGTDSPQAKLDVNGTLNVEGDVTMRGSVSIPTGPLDVSGGATIDGGIHVSGTSHFSEEVTGTISNEVTSGKYFPTLDWVNNRISTGGVGGWTETELSGNYNIHNANNGNVGIGTGTDSPQAKLDVNGTLNVEGDVTMRGSVSIPTGPLDVSGGATIDGGIHVSGTSHFSEEVTGTISNEVTSGKYFPTLDWVNNRISTGGVGGWTETELSGNYNIHNANNGNVGIGTGTDSPQAKLDVNGTLNVEGDVTMRGSVSIPTGPLDVSGGATIDGGIHVSGTSHFSEEVTGTISNEVTSGKYFPTLDWVNNRISTGGVGGWTETELSGNYNIHNANNGNVGIGTGTDSPQAKLDVNGTLNVEGDVTMRGSVSIPTGPLDVSGGATIDGGIHVSGTSHFSEEVTGTISNEVTSGKYFPTLDWVNNRISTGGVGGWTETELSGNYNIHNANNGNVGIGTGTDSPQAKLDVNGTLNVEGDVTMRGSVSIPTGPLDVSGGATIAGGIHVSGTSHFSEEVTGTISNEVTSGKYFPTLDWVNNRISTGGVGGWTETELSGNYNIHNANNGNVGIGTGTDSPQAKLDVNGTLNVEQDVTMRGSVSIPTGPLDVSGGATIDGGIHVSGTSHFSEEVTGTISNVVTSGKYFPTLDWVNNRISTGGLEGWTETDVSGNYIIHTTNNSNVGIGTDSPEAKLDVRGGLYVENDAVINGLTVGVGGGGSSTNCVVGRTAFGSNTTGTSNTAIGYSALYSSTSGNNNTAIGNDALYSSTSGNNNTATGEKSLYKNTTGSYNTATGEEALFKNTTGSYNIAIGYQSGHTNETGNNNTYIGSGTDCTDGSYNNSTAIGYNAQITKSDQIVFGQNTYADVVAPSVYIPGKVGIGTDTPSTALDVDGGVHVTDNLDVSGIITSSKDANIHGITIGLGGGNKGTNCVFGQLALSDNTQGSYNSVFGQLALSDNTQGSYNTAIGYDALNNNDIGTNNTAIGADAGKNNKSGDYNTFIGYGADCSNNNYVHSTAIGYNAMITNSNQIVLGQTASNSNSSTSSDNVAPTVYIPGNVGIGTDNPTSGYTLDVSGNVTIDGSLNITRGATISGTTTFSSPVYGFNSANVNSGAEFATLDWVNGKITAEGSGWAAASITNGYTNIYNTNTGGNVGIGTDNPTSTLDVSGSLNINNGLTVTGGNVGIGTDNPTSTLDVGGGVAIGSTYSGTSVCSC